MAAASSAARHGPARNRRPHLALFPARVLDPFIMKMRFDPARPFAVALALVMPLGGTALAQTGTAPAAPAYPYASSGDPAAMLQSNLRILAQNPYDLTALTQAGLGAIAIGDAQAAIGFLARAEELAPRDGRIKAALGTALLMVEKPADSMRFFAQAVSLGVSEHEIASDRGLAHDLLGEGKKAQRDYALALRRGSDPETVRRYALSMGIAGDKSDALKILDPLIRGNDQGAWRARSFILAMNGDLAEAERIANAAAPAALAGAMSPFLRRLESLTPTQRAYAVNFGTMPATGTRVAMANPDTAFNSINTATGASLIPRGEPLGPSPAAKVEISPREARRRAKEERELARLAERGRRAADRAVPQQPATIIAARSALPPPPRTSSPEPGATSTQTAPPTQSGVLQSATQRVGQRIAAVDPQRLPPEIRPPAAKSDGGSPLVRPPQQRVMVVQGATDLPPPEAVRAPVQQALPEPEAVPSQEVQIAAATPTPAVPEPVSRPAPEPVQVIDVAPGFVLQPSASVSPATSGSTVITEVPESSIPKAAPTGAEAVVFPAAEPVNLASPAPQPASAPAAVAPPAAEAPRGLAEIISTLDREAESIAAPLPGDAELRAARLAAKKKADAEAKLKAEADTKKKEEAEAAAEAKRNPARIWVQVATGSNKAGLPGTWRKLREQAPKALGKQSGWVAPYRATNRVLTGPFRSSGEARAMIAALAKEGVSATPYSSEAGQEVSRLGGR